MTLQDVRGMHDMVSILVLQGNTASKNTRDIILQHNTHL